MSEDIYDPRERLEIFLNAIRTGDVDDLPDPETREELYLYAIASKSPLPDTADASVGDALVLDSDKNPVWAAGGKKYYMHNVSLTASRGSFSVSIISDDSTPFTTVAGVAKWLNDHNFNSTMHAYPTGGFFNTSLNIIGLGAFSTDGANVYAYISAISFVNSVITSDSSLVSSLNIDDVFEI